ncbi:MAG: hypothetical protein DWI29_03865, partial [Planctomycetota bacterium]
MGLLVVPVSGEKTTVTRHLIVPVDKAQSIGTIRSACGDDRNCEQILKQANPSAISRNSVTRCLKYLPESESEHAMRHPVCSESTVRILESPASQGISRLSALLCVVIATLIVQSGISHAGVITYSASDAGAGPADPRPNSNAMAASFDSNASALGSLSIITFESAPLDAFTNLTISPGISISGSGPQTI